ncbi:hypothetical protein BDZ91DRAFT_828023 [Kalaharituber pfeilii]|nr:hypothetical protein BDZ91DRAFT_828023 [Kalaharituber pfeilii]
MESFCAPPVNVYDSYVTAPFFGPNDWVSTISAVPNGNIPDIIPELGLKPTFKDGGTIDFHNHIQRPKECMPQEMEFADVTDLDLPSCDGSPPGIVPQWTPDVGPSVEFRHHHHHHQMDRRWGMRRRRLQGLARDWKAIRRRLELNGIMRISSPDKKFLRHYWYLNQGREALIVAISYFPFPLCTLALIQCSR